MRVLVLTRYSSLGPSSRIRFYQYIPYLESHGIDFRIFPLLGNSYVRRLYNLQKQPVFPIVKAYLNRLNHLLQLQPYDLIWMEKELLPWLPAWAEGRLRRKGIPFVVDYDDAIFHRYNLNHNPLIRFVLGRSIENVMRQATTVVVGNEYLADYARGIGVNKLEYLPSVVDLKRYTYQEKQDKHFHIGWIGSPVTAPYLGLIKEALEQVRTLTSARIVLIGAGDRDPLPVEGKENHPWSVDNEVAQLQSLDVGIMPLPDEPFERGKCGYKLIQYMACGLPTVASPVGENKHIVDSGVTGYLASNREEWVEALLTLHQDAGLRLSMGEAGRRKVEHGYNLEMTEPRMLDILKKAAFRNAT